MSVGESSPAVVAEASPSELSAVFLVVERHLSDFPTIVSGGEAMFIAIQSGDVGGEWAAEKNVRDLATPIIVELKLAVTQAAVAPGGAYVHHSEIMGRILQHPNGVAVRKLFDGTNLQKIIQTLRNAGLTLPVIINIILQLVGGLTGKPLPVTLPVAGATA